MGGGREEGRRMLGRAGIPEGRIEGLVKERGTTERERGSGEGRTVEKGRDGQ